MFSSSRRNRGLSRLTRLTFENLEGRELLSVSQVGLHLIDLSAIENAASPNVRLDEIDIGHMRSIADVVWPRLLDADVPVGQLGTNGASSSPLPIPNEQVRSSVYVVQADIGNEAIAVDWFAQHTDGITDLAIRMAWADQATPPIYVAITAEPTEHLNSPTTGNRGSAHEANEGKFRVAVRDVDGDGVDELLVIIGHAPQGHAIVLFNSEMRPDGAEPTTGWIQRISSDREIAARWTQSVDDVFSTFQSRRTPQHQTVEGRPFGDVSPHGLPYRATGVELARGTINTQNTFVRYPRLWQGAQSGAHADLPVEPLSLPAPWSPGAALDSNDTQRLVGPVAAVDIASASALAASRGVDDEIGMLIAQRDETGLEHLLLHHGARVKAFLRGRYPTLKEEDVDEALIEGAFRVWRYFAPSRATSVGSFFVTTARSAAVDILRSDARRPHVNVIPHRLEMEAEERSLPQEAESDLREAMHKAISKLSSFEQAIVQADWNAAGKSGNKELAESFGVSSSAVTHARSNAYAKLRSLLADYDPRSGG